MIARQGQSLQLLHTGCSGSRVVPAPSTGPRPGEQRNVLAAVRVVRNRLVRDTDEPYRRDITDTTVAEVVRNHVRTRAERLGSHVNIGQGLETVRAQPRGRYREVPIASMREYRKESSTFETMQGSW
ncbi:hypothetical protein [Streptomyces sp. NPDC092370]|uniref:hypothetical protein n=1 Tax=Streptomyces sp. NPDC092370 TaxID=3366016 RepID=UPI00381DF2CF